MEVLLGLIYEVLTIACVYLPTAGGIDALHLKTEPNKSFMLSGPRVDS